MTTTAFHLYCFVDYRYRTWRELLHNSFIKKRKKQAHESVINCSISPFGNLEHLFCHEKMQNSVSFYIFRSKFPKDEYLYGHFIDQSDMLQCEDCRWWKVKNKVMLTKWRLLMILINNLWILIKTFRYDIQM